MTCVFFVRTFLFLVGGVRMKVLGRQASLGWTFILRVVRWLSLAASHSRFARVRCWLNHLTLRSSQAAKLPFEAAKQPRRAAYLRRSSFFEWRVRCAARNMKSPFGGSSYYYPMLTRCACEEWRTCTCTYVEHARGLRGWSRILESSGICFETTENQERILFFGVKIVAGGDLGLVIFGIKALRLAHLRTVEIGLVRRATTSDPQLGGCLEEGSTWQRFGGANPAIPRIYRLMGRNSSFSDWKTTYSRGYLTTDSGTSKTGGEEK